MKGIIIDDEERGRSLLKNLCTEYCKNLEIVGLGGSITEGLDLIERHRPELVFLDIRMPVEDGFSLFHHFEKPPFSVIFTTAHEQYALKAMKHFAVDYLLKPISIDRLLEAVHRADIRLQAMDSVRRYNQLQDFLQEHPIGKIGLPTKEGLMFLYHKEIIRCEAQGSYTKLFQVNGQTVLITRTLKHFEDLLKSEGFVRIHKSHLINLSHLRKYLRTKPNLIEMRDGTQLEVSPLRKELLLKRLEAK